MAANQVLTLRHDAVFSAEVFGDKKITIVGAGASGSKIALSLAKLGVRNLEVWDFDVVEEHNTANQVFGIEDIGKPKVEALADLIRAQTGLEIVAHNEKVDKDTKDLGSIVFLLTDTMASRKEIWKGCIRLNPRIDLMVETRMGASEGRVYSVRPSALPEVKLWESTLYDDDESTESLCGSQISVGPTADFINALAVWSFITWFKWTFKDGVRTTVETIFWLDPNPIITERGA